MKDLKCARRLKNVERFLNLEGEIEVFFFSGFRFLSDFGLIFWFSSHFLHVFSDVAKFFIRFIPSLAINFSDFFCGQNTVQRRFKVLRFLAGFVVEGDELISWQVLIK